MNTEEKKIAVIGIGGVGGYIAGLLAKAYPHVTMVARGARAESIRKKGLVLHSDYKGEIVAKPERVVPIQDMGQQDYIFICVKNYSLAEVCESIRDMVTDDTVIIPVMNGVDPGENIRRLVGKGTVVDSLIGDGTCEQCHMHRRNKSVTLADRGLHHKCVRRIIIQGKATGFIGIQRKRPIKEQILCSTFQSISSQTKAHICKCTITGMCKCGIKILLSMYCTIVTLDRVVIHCDTSLTQIGISLQ